MYYWVAAVLEPDLEWHEDFIWEIPTELP
jgi:hypothetical protein